MIRAGRVALLAGAVLAGAGREARAERILPRDCSPASAQRWTARPPTRARAVAWPAPLDQLASFDAGDLPLGAALDRVAERTGIHLLYSPDLVPTQREVCLSVEARPVGDILVTLLAGTGILPVVVGAREIVLAPARSSAGAEAAPVTARAPGVLERVVVTGTTTGAPQRASPFAVATVDRASMPANATLPLASLLDAAVPGVWIWTQSPVSALARYGSIRGASSFGVSTPKIYIDGIEVANPLLLTALDPAQVERIEVIRGPQGAALYGADAISGVVNIQTRHDGAESGGTSTTTRVSAGSSASAYADGGVLAQEHALDLRSGSAARSASLGLSMSSLGQFTPGASARQALAHASARHVGERLIVTATARFQGSNAVSPASPILRALLASPATSTDSAAQRIRQYTLGGTATLQASERWEHALTVGVDGYRLAGVAGDPTPLPSLSDSAIAAARGGADRLTVRLSSTRRLGDDADGGASRLSFGLEHSTARERSSGMGTLIAPRIDAEGPTDSDSVSGAELADADSVRPATVWWTNTGLFSQAQLALTPSLFVTGGARVEHISGPSESGRLAWLPMLGGSWVNDAGPWTLKLRAAYGRGIRPARTVARGASFSGAGSRAAFTSLAPEEQAGVEVGFDAFAGDRFALHVTRFDQRASGLVQPVAVLGALGGGRPGSPETARVLYQLQNVGAIANAGWEVQGASSFGPLVLAATMTQVESRVARLASGYQGDLHEGDRMLEVPARTMGLQARWTQARWSLDANLSRAFDWVNYDQVALAQVLAADPTGRLAPVGEALRAYWREYDGVTRLGAGATVQLASRVALTLAGTNLLNRQVGEPDNVTVVPGRSVIVGLRTTFR